MNATASGAKGLKAEELVRAYFLRAGFFVVRGIVLRHEGIDLTDIDIWVYERSATLARRRTIIDVKDRKTPQAAERLFFVKGVAAVIGVEGAGVATPDSRGSLRELARKNGVLWIDGTDLQRLKSSDALSGQGRLTEEEFYALVAAVDDTRGGRNLREKIDFMKSAVASRFGPACANASIDCFQYCAGETVIAHPGSETAVSMARVCYLSAAVAAAAFDFTSADTALRPVPERMRHMTDAIRLGADAEGAYANLRWAEAAIREYLPNGTSLARTVKKRFIEALEAVRAEGLAEIVIKLSNSERLFEIAKSLEQAAYAQRFIPFDQISSEAKGFLGALLDFSNINRKRFADASSTQSATSHGDQRTKPLSGSDVEAQADGQRIIPATKKDDDRLL